MNLRRWPRGFRILLAIVIARLAVWGVRNLGIVSDLLSLPVGVLVGGLIAYWIPAEGQEKRGLYWLLVVILALLAYLSGIFFPAWTLRH